LLQLLHFDNCVLVFGSKTGNDDCFKLSKFLSFSAFRSSRFLIRRNFDDDSIVVILEVENEGYAVMSFACPKCTREALSINNNVTRGTIKFYHSSIITRYESFNSLVVTIDCNFSHINCNDFAHSTPVEKVNDQFRIMFAYIVAHIAESSRSYWDVNVCWLIRALIYEINWHFRWVMTT
jgi:hypothetical protein